MILLGWVLNPGAAGGQSAARICGRSQPALSADSTRTSAHTTLPHRSTGSPTGVRPRRPAACPGRARRRNRWPAPGGDTGRGRRPRRRSRPRRPQKLSSTAFCRSCPGSTPMQDFQNDRRSSTRVTYCLPAGPDQGSPGASPDHHAVRTRAVSSERCRTAPARPPRRRCVQRGTPAASAGRPAAVPAGRSRGRAARRPHPTGRSGVRGC